jgi:hypothetical protein
MTFEFGEGLKLMGADGGDMVDQQIQQKQAELNKLMEKKNAISQIRQ